MEAPYVRIDPILGAFAERHRLELYRNYRDADRSLRFNDDLSRAIWVNSMDKYGKSGAYQVSVLAHQDRPERYIKGEFIADDVPIAELDQTLEQAAARVLSWSASDLELAKHRK
jgi:hypothetical protein